jgi:hypothetical protein
MQIDAGIVVALSKTFGTDVTQEALELYALNFDAVPKGKDREWLFACAAVESLHLED